MRVDIFVLLQACSKSWRTT